MLRTRISQCCCCGSKSQGGERIRCMTVGFHVENPERKVRDGTLYQVYQVYQVYPVHARHAVPGQNTLYTTYTLATNHTPLRRTAHCRRTRRLAARHTTVGPRIPRIQQTLAALATRAQPTGYHVYNVHARHAVPGQNTLYTTYTLAAKHTPLRRTAHCRRSRRLTQHLFHVYHVCSTRTGQAGRPSTLSHVYARRTPQRRHTQHVYHVCSTRTGQAGRPSTLSHVYARRTPQRRHTQHEGTPPCTLVCRPAWFCCHGATWPRRAAYTAPVKLPYALLVAGGARLRI